jgi:hypothetical protein
MCLCVGYFVSVHIIFCCLVCVCFLYVFSFVFVLSFLLRSFFRFPMRPLGEKTNETVNGNTRGRFKFPLRRSEFLMCALRFVKSRTPRKKEECCGQHHGVLFPSGRLRCRRAAQASRAAAGRTTAASTATALEHTVQRPAATVAGRAAGATAL